MGGGGGQLPSSGIGSQRSIPDADTRKKLKTIGAKPAQKPIKDLKTFTKDFDRIFDELDDEFNYKNLVPIYQIRRRFGDRVGRKEFDDYMLELQGQGKIQLYGEDFRGSPDKIRDSIFSPVSGLRAFAIRLDKKKRKR